MDDEHADNEKFFMVMLRSTPKDIISFCQVDKKMNSLCKKERVMVTLINHFFPYRILDYKNLYRQFVILSNTTTIYLTPAERANWAEKETKFGTVLVPDYTDDNAYLAVMKKDTTKNMTKEERTERMNEMWRDNAVIEIAGTPFKTGSKIWVVMFDYDDKCGGSTGLGKGFFSPQSWVFKTKTEAIQKTVERIFPALYQRLEIYVSEFDDSIDKTARFFYLPTPFTIQSLIEAFEEYGFVTMQTDDDPTTTETFTLRHLTFI